MEITECSPLPDGRFYLEIVGRRRFRPEDTAEQVGRAATMLCSLFFSLSLFLSFLYIVRGRWHCGRALAFALAGTGPGFPPRRLSCPCSCALVSALSAEQAGGRAAPTGC